MSDDSETQIGSSVFDMKKRKKRISTETLESPRKSLRRCRRMVAKDREWSLFFFNVEEKNLAAVPLSWITTYKGLSGDKISKCWWPKENSNEATATTFNMLVKNCSEPDYETWEQHIGLNLGCFKSFEKCLTSLEKYEATISTDSEDPLGVVKEITAKIRREAKEATKASKKEESHKLAKLTETCRRADISKSVKTPTTVVASTPLGVDLPAASSSSMYQPLASTSKNVMAVETSVSEVYHDGVDPTSSTARRCLSDKFLEITDVHEQTESNEQTLKSIAANLRLLLEGQKEILDRLTDYERNMEDLKKDLKTLMSVPVRPSTSTAVDRMEEAEEEDEGLSIVKQMASPLPEVRAKTNYLQCLDVLGFPVTTSLEDLKLSNKRFDGEDKLSIRRRNALANALTALAPRVEAGRKTVHAVIRACLYAIAPAYLWQFFSSQGKSGSSRANLLTDMPNIYKAVISAGANRCNQVDKISLIKVLSDVIRSCQTRAESKKYLKENPGVLTSSVEQNPIEDFSGDEFLVERRSTRRVVETSEESISNDSVIPTSSSPNHA